MLSYKATAKDKVFASQRDIGELVFSIVRDKGWLLLSRWNREYDEVSGFQAQSHNIPGLRILPFPSQGPHFSTGGPSTPILCPLCIVFITLTESFKSIIY